MAALTKNAISVTVRERVKRTQIWDHIQIVIRASFVFCSCYKGHTKFVFVFQIFVQARRK